MKVGGGFPILKRLLQRVGISDSRHNPGYAGGLDCGGRKEGLGRKALPGLLWLGRVRDPSTLHRFVRRLGCCAQGLHELGITKDSQLEKNLSRGKRRRIPGK